VIALLGITFADPHATADNPMDPHYALRCLVLDLESVADQHGPPPISFFPTEIFSEIPTEMGARKFG
jgi:hypothetical protein